MAKCSALLHFEGTNGASVFTDATGKTWSKGKNGTEYPITSTTSPIVGASSGKFPTDSYIKSVASADFRFSGDFTLQFFVRLPTSGSVSFGHLYGETACFYLSCASSGLYFCYYETPDISHALSTSGLTLSAGTAYWVQVIRAGDVLRLTVDDTVVASQSGFSSYVFGSSTQQLYLTGYAYSGTLSIDELRIVQGSAVDVSRTQASAGLTTALTVWVTGSANSALDVTGNAAGYTQETFLGDATGAIDLSGDASGKFVLTAKCTSLLHFEGSEGASVFTDATGKAWTAVPVNYYTPYVSASWTPYNVAINAIVNSRFGVFRNAEYITTPAHADFQFGYDFTIQFFVQPIGYGTILATGSSGTNFYLWIGSPSTLSFVVTVDGTNTIELTSSVALPTDAWSWVQIIREGTSLRMTFDDVVVATGSIADGTTFNSSSGMTLGAVRSAIDELRIVKDGAVDVTRAQALAGLISSLAAPVAGTVSTALAQDATGTGVVVLATGYASVVIDLSADASGYTESVVAGDVNTEIGLVVEATGVVVPFSYGSADGVLEMTGEATGATEMVCVCVSLLHFEGSNGASVFTDEVSGTTWNYAYDAVNPPTTTTANPILGSSSGSFNGDGTIYSEANYSGKYWFNNDFTVQFFVRPGTDNALLTPSVGNLRWYASDAKFVYVVYFLVNNDYVPVTLDSSSMTLSAGTAYWVQVIREGDVLRLTVDDVVVASCTGASGQYLGGSGLIIGNVSSDGITDGLVIDEFRVFRDGAQSVTRARALLGLTTAPTTTTTATGDGAIALTATGTGVSGDNPAVSMSVCSSLLHFDGVNGASVFTDETGKLWTAEAPYTVYPITSTTSPLVGSACGYFSDGALIRTPAHADFNFDGDFTIQFFGSVPADGNLQLSNLGSGGFRVTIFDDVSVSFEWNDGEARLNTKATRLFTNTTYWIQLIRCAGTLFILVDDVVLASCALAALITSTNSLTLSGAVGARIDELRIVKGIAAYVPRSQALGGLIPYVSTCVNGHGEGALLGGDASGAVVNSTVGGNVTCSSLLHFDGVNGAQEFIDETGKTWASYNYAPGTRLNTSYAIVGTSSCQIATTDNLYSVGAFASDTDCTFQFFAGVTSADSIYMFDGVFSLTWSGENRQFVFTSGAHTLNSSALSLGINRWYWVQLIREGDVLYLTVDDVVAGYLTGMAGVQIGTGTLHIGGCLIDEFRAFNNAAVSVTRANALFGLGTGANDVGGAGEALVSVDGSAQGSVYSADVAYGSAQGVLDLAALASGFATGPLKGVGKATLVSAEAVGRVVVTGGFSASLLQSSGVGKRVEFVYGSGDILLSAQGHGKNGRIGDGVAPLVFCGGGLGEVIDAVCGAATADVVAGDGYGMQLSGDDYHAPVFILSRPNTCEVLTHAL